MVREIGLWLTSRGSWTKYHNYVRTCSRVKYTHKNIYTRLTSIVPYSVGQLFPATDPQFSVTVVDRSESKGNRIIAIRIDLSVVCRVQSTYPDPDQRQ